MHQATGQLDTSPAKVFFSSTSAEGLGRKGPVGLFSATYVRMYMRPVT